jgi:hypothetical protein
MYCPGPPHRPLCLLHETGNAPSPRRQHAPTAAGQHRCANAVPYPYMRCNNHAALATLTTDVYGYASNAEHRPEIGKSPESPHSAAGPRHRQATLPGERSPTTTQLAAAHPTTTPDATSRRQIRPMPFYPLLHPSPRPRNHDSCVLPPNPGMPVNFCPFGIRGRPKFSSRSRITLSALRLRRYGSGDFASASPSPGSTCPPGPSLVADPGSGNDL